MPCFSRWRAAILTCTLLLASSSCARVSHQPERVWPDETPGAYGGDTPATAGGAWWFPSQIGPKHIPTGGGNKGTIFYTGEVGPGTPPRPVVPVLPPPEPGVVRRVVYHRVYVEKDVRIERLIFPAITFEFGRTAVDAESHNQLRQAAAAIKRARGYDVVIEGHRESDEGESVDRDRAEVVQGVLVELGVPAQRLRVEALGDTRPLASNGGDIGRALNRRAAFQFVPASLELDPQGPPDDPMPEVPRGMRLETVNPTVTISRPRLVFVDRLVFPNILFDYDKAQLRPEGALRADRAAASVRALDHVARVTVAGHCDAIGKHEYNDALSLRRAGAVRDRLVATGVPAHMVAAVGHGKRQPIADNDTHEGRQLNRRVEFSIEYAE